MRNLSDRGRVGQPSNVAAGPTYSGVRRLDAEAEYVNADVRHEEPSTLVSKVAA